ncbi:hypothetical protein REPUB_Repub20aG0032700 [Reevesia pubescens]
MAIASLTKATTLKQLSLTQYFSTIPHKISQYKNQNFLANLLQRDGFLNLETWGISPLVICNALALSWRFQIHPYRFLKSVGVLKGLGFKGRVLTKVLEGFPKGVLELGFSEIEIREEIVRETRVLGMELGEMSRSLGLLRTLKCRVPIKDMIFSEGEFRTGLKVKLRVDCLCKHRMKYGVGCLVEVPEYLGANFDKQIVPRNNVIEYLRSKGALGFELGLESLTKPSRLRFYNLYVKPYPECEKMIGRFAESASI